MFFKTTSTGYAVLVEKVGLFWKKPYFFSDCQVLVVWGKSRAFSKKALLFPKLPGFLIIRGIPSMFWKSRACFNTSMEIKPWINIAFAASLIVCCDVISWLWCKCNPPPPIPTWPWALLYWPALLSLPYRPVGACAQELPAVPVRPATGGGGRYGQWLPILNFFRPASQKFDRCLETLAP